MSTFREYALSSTKYLQPTSKRIRPAALLVTAIQMMNLVVPASNGSRNQRSAFFMLAFSVLDKLGLYEDPNP